MRGSRKLSKSCREYRICTIDIQIYLCDTNFHAGMACPKSAILIEEEVVPKMDSSTRRSAAASLLALRM